MRQYPGIPARRAGALNTCCTSTLDADGRASTLDPARCAGALNTCCAGTLNSDGRASTLDAKASR